MKKIIATLLVLALLFPAVLAEGEMQGSGSEDKGMIDEDKGMTDQGNMPEEQGMGEGQGDMLIAPAPIMVRERQQNMAGSPEELRTMVQNRKQQMEQEMQGMDEDMQKVFRNQNKVREAVHALLAMEDLTGGIGPQVREVARNFNNSVQATIRAEERVENRGGFKRFFAGGDAEAAEELEKEVNQNRERIQQLKQLREQCDCGEEVKTMMQEQIQNMEQEQERLGELAQKEKSKKGLFGWIWK